MARITYVAHAQQRYATVPVIDPATGEQKRTPVMKGGVQRRIKRGEPIFLSVTVADKSQPLPNRKCGKCGKEIEVGNPYKSIAIRSTYGGSTLYRCEACPNWQVWEYSSSLSARLAEISYNFSQALDGVTEPDEVTSALSEAAEAIREIATEKQESADNIEEGFGHETTQSQELRDIGEQLESWADDVENADVPDAPEPEEGDCDECMGTTEVENPAWADLVKEHKNLVDHLADAEKRLWILRALPLNPQVQVKINDLTRVDGLIPNLKADLKANLEAQEQTEDTVDCEACNGSGQVTPDEPTDDQMAEWLDEVRDACSIIDESPV